MFNWKTSRFSLSKSPTLPIPRDCSKRIVFELPIFEFCDRGLKTIQSQNRRRTPASPHVSEVKRGDLLLALSRLWSPGTNVACYQGRSTTPAAKTHVSYNAYYRVMNQVSVALTRVCQRLRYPTPNPKPPVVCMHVSSSSYDMHAPRQHRSACRSLPTTSPSISNSVLCVNGH